MPSLIAALEPANLFPASPDDLNFIRNTIKSLDLDGSDISASQFLLYKTEHKIVGFGRIKNHGDFDEICSLAVLTEYRNQGIARILLKELIHRCRENVYIVSVIPDLFSKFGFEPAYGYPESILAKKADCRHLCHCETPVVMLLKKQPSHD